MALFLLSNDLQLFIKKATCSAPKDRSFCATEHIASHKYLLDLFCITFEMFFQKSILLPQQMEDVLFGCISVRFARQNHHTNRGAEIFQGLEIAFRLHGKCSRIIISCTMDQQHRRLPSIGTHEGRHRHIKIEIIPQIALLRLEPERGQRSVVCTRTSYTCSK